MEIRRLTTADAAAYQALRLKGLCEEPTAFASSYEEERAYPLSKYEEWLGVPPDRGAIGAFDGEELVGIVTLGRESHRHLAHKALIMGMYVRGDRQGRGIGRMLLQQVIDLARSVAEIRQVNIIANAANAPAQKLYESLGFRAYGRELRSMRIHGEWYDEVLMSLDLGKD